MIDEVDHMLANWSMMVLPDIPVSLHPPGSIAERPCVGIYLMDLLPAPARHSSRSVPLQLTLRYLVTTWHEQPGMAHGLLARLLRAAADSQDFDVEMQPLPAGTWAAFGLPPRPVFMLRVPLRMTRPEPESRTVHRGVEVVHRALGDLSGLLLGPDDIPLANARIELMGFDAKAVTDSKGRFRLKAVPVMQGTRRLRIAAKGQTMIAHVTVDDDQAKPVIIRLDQLEK